LRAKTSEDRKILELIDPVAESQGVEVVRVRLMSGAVRRLQIMAEDPATHDFTIEQCTRLSRAVSAVMDAADPISGEYTLEVSSPGVDRPLTRLADFETYAGLEARVELDRLVENRKRFKGEIAGVEGDTIGLNLEGETEETAWLPFAWVSEAKLVMNDALMKRGAEARAARVAAEGGEEDEEDPLPLAGEGDHEVVERVDDGAAAAAPLPGSAGAPPAAQGESRKNDNAKRKEGADEAQRAPRKPPSPASPVLPPEGGDHDDIGED
jgi:ribosome maturation factor RimP